MQPEKLSHCRYDDVWLTFDLIGDPAFPLVDVQSSHVESLATSMRALVFVYLNRMIGEAWSAECNPTKFAMEDAVAVKGGRKVVKHGFKMF